MSILYRNGSKLASTLPLILAAVLFISLIQTITAPVHIQATEGSASIRFDIAAPLWYGNCVNVQWDVEQIVSVYLNGTGLVGQGADISCQDQLPTLTVQLADESVYTFGPDAILATRDKLFFEFIAIILLLVFRIIGARTGWFVAIGLIGLAGWLIPREVLEPLATTLDSVSQSALSVFNIADKFSIIFPLGCLIAALYWLFLPRKVSHVFLFASSILAVILLGASLEYVLFVFILVIVTYVVSSQPAIIPERSYRRLFAFITIGAILVALFVVKRQSVGVDFLGWIGFSYLAFRLLHVLIDSLNNRFTDASPLELLTYALFYPALLVGPIDRLPRFFKDLRQKDKMFSWTYIITGLTRIAIGVIKKFFVADILLAPLALGITLPLPYNTVNAWSQVLGYSLYIFFDFSGYVDIALGLAYLVGFTLPENFDSPYLKVNIAQFWQAWHITLSNWLRSYVFLPLSGRLIRTRLRKHPNVIIFIGQMTTMMLIGLWHGLTLNFLMWGLWHGIGLFLHKIYSDWAKPYVTLLAEYRVLHSLYTFMGWALTFTFVSLGWVFFALPNLSSSEYVFRTLFNMR